MVTVAQPGGDFAALIGLLYARWTLDCLIEMGWAVSADFITRPQLYVSDDIPDAIVKLRMKYGSDPDFPNTTQRHAMLLPILSKSDGLKPDSSTASSQFYIARKKFIDACIAFSERAVDTGIPMLEERVRSALVTFRAHFDALHGKSVQLSNNQINAISETAISILKAPGAAKIFGVSPPDAGWPLDSNDPNGAKLVESIGSQLPLPQECKLGYTKFILLQRVAQEGRRTLPLVLSTDPNSEQKLLALISQAYTWGTSLREYQQTL